MMTDPETRDDRPTFPHLDNLERVLVAHPDYLSGPVTVTEKVHGFNARIGVDLDGKLWYGGRNQDFDSDDPCAPGLQGFGEFVRGLEHRPPAGTTIFGEWAGTGVQKSIDYGEKRFFAFAGKTAGSLVGSSTEILDRLWEKGLTTVHVFNEGVVTLDHLKRLRDGPSALAKVAVDADGFESYYPLEGVVIAPLDPVIDVYGHQVIAKYKGARFSELTHVRERKSAPDTSTVDAIAAEYVNSERLRHVLDKVAEAHPTTERVGKIVIMNVDPLDVQHTGDVLRTMYQDVVEDAAAAVAALSDDDKRKLGKAVNKITLPLLAAAREAAAVASMETIA